MLYNLIISAFFAMITMTTFSYIISNSFRKLYKEPVLLTYFLDKLGIETSSSMKIFLAWLLHYLIGLGFVLGYHLIWKNNILPLTWTISILLGTSSGIIGVLGWMLIFSYTNHRPKIDFKGYYIQLVLAHIIFGVTAYAVYVQFL